VIKTNGKGKKAARKTKAACDSSEDAQVVNTKKIESTRKAVAPKSKAAKKSADDSESGSDVSRPYSVVEDSSFK